VINLSDPAVAKFRDLAADRWKGTSDEGRQWGGAFRVPFRASRLSREVLLVIASRGDPEADYDEDRWDHVSVSLERRCPTWEEMEFIKRLFFKPEETAMQLHVPVARHISAHPFCLHIWRPVDREIPRPPPILVAPEI
jgi:hypothetical protein